MDRHKSLYKENSFALSPRQHKQINREHRNEDRAKKRSDIFQSSRNILDTPLSTHNEDFANTPINVSAASAPLPMTVKNNMEENANKENAQVMEKNNFNDTKNASYVSRIAMVASNTSNTKKLSRQEAFLKRFLNWKDVKKEEDMLKKQTKKPAFVPPGAITTKTTKIVATKMNVATASFVPQNHPHHFQPPKGLKNPAAKVNDASVASTPNEKLDKSLYTVVSTPKKKKAVVDRSVKKAGPHSIFDRFNSIPAKAALCTNSKTNGFLSNKKTVAATKIAKEKPIPTATTTKENAIPAATTTKEKPVSAAAIKTKEKPIPALRTTTTRAILKSADNKSTTSTTNSTNNSGKLFLKPRPLILPPPSPRPLPKIRIKRKTAGNAVRVAKPITGGGTVEQSTSTAGACGKVKLLQSKRNDTLSKRPTQPQKNAKLAVKMKAKIPAGGTAVGGATAARSFKLKGKPLLNPSKESLPMLETPTELANVNPYAVFLTSTQFKSCAIESATTLTAKTRDDEAKKFGDSSDLISPIEVSGGTPDKANVMQPPFLPKHTSSILAKRALLQGDKKRKDKLLPPKEKANQRKFNFVCYSEVDSPMPPKSKRSMHCQDLANIEILESAPKNNVGVAPLIPSTSKRASSTINSLIKENVGGEKGKVKLTPKVKSNKQKFNFVRHSETVDSPMLSKRLHQLEQKKDEIVQEKANAKESAALVKLHEIQLNASTEADCDATIVNKEHNTVVAYQSLPIQRTPSEEQNGERPANYLSPFVSVSRGKVSAKTEREKRNSIYLQTPPEDIADFIEKDKEQKKKETIAIAEMLAETVEFRRTLETVRYFRKQVSDQIARLHDMCDHWEAYKQQELTRLQETAGDDMIDVTIGQTKLLTSKKFKQFTGLVDRCEAIAMGVAAGAPLMDDDGSEATKLITVADLEGFWSMVGLQIDNVDKRFENLERWKANKWIDPDEVKAKAKKNLAKVKKATTNTVNAASKAAKPSSSLQLMLRKMQAEMRKNKAMTTAANTNNTANNLNDINNIVKILTPPSRKRRSHSGTPTSVQRRVANATSTSGRISVIVKDRKSRSAAATVISIPSPASSSSSAMRRRPLLTQCQIKQLNVASPSLNSSINELKRSLTGLRKTCERNDLLKTALVGAAAEQQRRNSIHATNTPKAQLTPPRSPPASALSRKSILKTPGTAKGKPKNVIFNDELRIKKFKFTLEGDENDSDDEIQRTKNMSNENLEEESDKRTYSLRNRKVVLRPSSEFEIPRA